jgi:hypothetical protein
VRPRLLGFHTLCCADGPAASARRFHWHHWRCCLVPVCSYHFHVFTSVLTCVCVLLSVSMCRQARSWAVHIAWALRHGLHCCYQRHCWLHPHRTKPSQSHNHHSSTCCSSV